MIIHPAPGYVLARYSKTGETTTPGGVLLPPGSTFVPVVRIVADGGPPELDINREILVSNDPFRVEEGLRVVVAGAEQMIDMGYDQLYLIPYSAIVASVEDDS
jgi:hypothetical protein